LNNHHFLLLGAGSGTRFDPNKPKQIWEIEPRITLAEKTLLAVISSPLISNILIVSSKEQEDFFKKLRVNYIIGGSTRQESARLGLEALVCKKPNKILIHDLARPFLSPEVIGRVVDALDSYEAVDLALPIVDTIKSHDGTLLDRNNLYATQTPQGFLFPVILEKHRSAFHQGNNCYSDDIGLYLGEGGNNWTKVPGCPKNKKITYKEDLL
jgi:2-C-methyl-D-erythritol 4-phosphate cytidylyltransferase/2-C-methyl-D-erythritol 2,4-cyclodiphosphate synthase